jgi:hypothetical protein
MGSPDVRAYSRNKRGIAGSLIWVNFDRHALLNLFWNAGATFLADADEIRPQYQNGEDAGAVFASSLSRDMGPSIGSTIDQMDLQTLSSVGQTAEEVAPWYSDQVLPFDVTLAGANEYGAMAYAKIFGIEILNEGSGISIDDAVTEMQATFVARAVEPMTAVEPVSADHDRAGTAHNSNINFDLLATRENDMFSILASFLISYRTIP